MPSTKVLEPTMIAAILFAPNQGSRFFWMFFRFCVRSRQVSGGTAQSPQGPVKAAGSPISITNCCFHPTESHSIAACFRFSRIKRLSNDLEQIILGEGLLQHNISKIEAARSYMFTSVARHENSFQARPERAQ